MKKIFVLLMSALPALTFAHADSHEHMSMFDMMMHFLGEHGFMLLAVVAVFLIVRTMFR